MFLRVYRGQKGTVLKLLFLALVLAGCSGATTINLPATVTITSPGGGLIGTEQWTSGASLTSTVTLNDGVYNYEYTWSEPDKAISHIIIELCLSLAADQIEGLLDIVYVNG